MVAFLDRVSPQLGALGGGVRGGLGEPRRSPAPRAGTGPSSAPAPRGSALRPTSAGRRGGGARSSARAPARSAPRSSASRDPPRSAEGSQENSGAVRPQAHDIAVPPFPPGTQWVGPEPGAVERICARGPLLVHFVDAAHLSSVRTLPYVRAWEERYRDLGLTLVGVNSPRFPFTADAGKLAAALARLEVGFPVAADSGYRIWHDYGCEGWPSLFLWGRGGALRWFHFGEGEYGHRRRRSRRSWGEDGPALGAERRRVVARARGEYAATEEAIQEELRALDPGDSSCPSPACPSAQRRRGRARRAAQRRGLPGRLGVRAVASARRRPAARARLRGGRRLGDDRRAGRAARLAGRWARARDRGRGARRLRAGRPRAPRGAPPVPRRHARRAASTRSPSRRECPEPNGCDPRAGGSAPSGQLDPDLLREHEADVLVDGAQLRDLLRPALAKEGDEL